MWSVKADGSPLDRSKQIYGQSFAIYGLSEYFLASGDKSALARAIEDYRLVEQYSHDHALGGYIEAFTNDWQRPAGLRLSHVGLDFPKSQNTHLHLMESYTNLYRAWPDAGLKRNLNDLVEVMLNRIITPNGKYLGLFFDADWTPRSHEISYGHNIEANWLLCETADVIGDPDLKIRARTAALKLAQSTLEEGVDTDGGILNESGPNGLIDSDKEWWPQAEATVGFLNAYQISGDPRYLLAARQSWNFIETRLVDRVHGEWFHGTKRDGTVQPDEPKISLWKCPYHNTRACLEFADRLREIAAAGKI
jgi:mannobiose 2-epimerase